MAADYEINPMGITSRIAINRNLSAEMDRIRVMSGRLMEKSVGTLCSYTPHNFVGALLATLNADLFRHYYPLRVPGLVSKAVTLEHNIPLYVLSDHQVRQQPYILDDVLVKHGIVFTAGVVLNGPFAGLILQKREGKTPRQGMIANRIWNDSQLKRGENFYPDHPSFDNTPLFNMKNYYAVQQLYEQLFLAAVGEQESELGRMPWMSEIFFALCKQAHLPLDVSCFHIARQVQYDKHE